MWTWWKRLRRARLVGSPFPRQWLAYSNDIRLYTWLPESAQKKLQRIIRILVAEKHWEGCGGMQVDDRVKVTIAAQAALLVLKFHEVYFEATPTVLVYPDTYWAPHKEPLGSGVVLEGWQARDGEAWYRGPVILSWNEVLAAASGESDGRNVVIHEFAHQLDMLDGEADGTPPVSSLREKNRWRSVCQKARRSSLASVEIGSELLFDEQALESSAEFFAVTCEYFWMNPRKLKYYWPQLYELWQSYFRQDPAAFVRWDAPFSP